MKRWTLVLGGMLCFGCAEGGGGNLCPIPDTESAELTLEQANDFGRNYEIFELMYKLDDCNLYQSRDTAVLRKPTVDLGKHVVPAGPHKLQVLVRFRSDFGADMHGYEWWWRGGNELELPADERLLGQVRFFEQEDADPRDRMRMDMKFAKLEAAPAAAAAEPAPAPAPESDAPPPVQ